MILGVPRALLVPGDKHCSEHCVERELTLRGHPVLKHGIKLMDGMAEKDVNSVGI
jgi:hypothetical protein